jgi:lipopolysaccharide cholinephosphotransferase
LVCAPCLAFIDIRYPKTVSVNQNLQPAARCFRIHSNCELSLFLAYWLNLVEELTGSPGHFGLSRIIQPATLASLTCRSSIQQFYKDFSVAGQYKLEGQNGIDAVKMLIRITDALDRLKIDYTLEGGTLLGIIREDRLLPWDNDMDLTIIEDKLPRLPEILSALKKLGYIVRVKYFEKDSSPFIKGDPRIIKLRTRKLYFIKGPVKLEIFIKFKQDDQYFWQVGPRKKSVAAEFYENLTDWVFAGKKFRIPAEYTRYLETRFGKDWKVPVKVWNTFKQDKAIVGDL